MENYFSHMLEVPEDNSPFLYVACIYINYLGLDIPIIIYEDVKFIMYTFI